MAAPSLGAIDLNIGLSARDLKRLESASGDIQSGVDEFVKSASKVGFSKQSIRDIEQAGSRVAEVFASGMKTAEGIRSKMLKAEEQYQRALQEALDAGGKARAAADFEAAKDRIKMEWDALRSSLDAEKKALDQRLRTQQGYASAIGRSYADEMREASLKGGGLESSAAEVMTGGLKDAFGSIKEGDLKGMIKGISKASAGAGGGAEMMGMGQMGKALGSLSAAAATLAAVVGPLAAIIGILWKADQQAKEFNKTILDGAGAADFAFGKEALSGRALEGQLADLRGAAVAVSMATRENAKDILSAMKAANEAGLQYAEMEKFVTGAGSALEAYQSYAEVSVRQARMLGVGISEVSSQMATWSEDLGGDLEYMDKSLTMISKAAMMSGFGTKRLFTAVSQATSGLAIYNSRIDDTIALMATLSGSLGKTGASEFVKALQSGFSDRGYQERFKQILIAGSGDVSEIMGTEAAQTARVFREKFSESLGTLDLSGTAAEGVGVQIKEALGEGRITDAIDSMAKMSEKELRSLLTQVERQGGPEMRQQMETMVRLSKGTTGSISEQAKALDAMGPGGKLAFQITSGLGGRAISEMSALELAAFESYAGISGEQLVQLRRVDTELRGNYERLKEIEAAAKTSAAEAGQERVVYSPEMIEELKSLGAVMETDEEGHVLGPKMDEQGNLLDAQGNKLDNVSKYIQGQPEALASALDVPLSAELAISETIQRNTISLASVVENTIVGLLEQLTFINQGIWDATLGLPDMVSDFKDSNITILEEGIQKADAQIAEQEAALEAAKEAAAQTQGGTDERTAALAKVEEIDALLSETRAIKSDYEADLRDVRSMTAGDLALATAGTAGIMGVEAGTDMWRGMGEYVTNPIVEKALVASGLSTEEEARRGSEEASAFIEGLIDETGTIASLFGVGRTYQRGMTGTGLESAALAEDQVGLTEDQIAATEEGAEEQVSATDDVAEEVSDLPGAIAEEEARSKLSAMGVEGSALDKAVRAVSTGRWGQTGLESDVLERFKSSVIGGGGGAGAGTASPPENPVDGQMWNGMKWDALTGQWTYPESELAAGGIVTRPTHALIGEAGPEAVVPLGRGGAGGVGNNVTVNIYGGDPKKLYEQLKAWGVV